MASGNVSVFVTPGVLKLVPGAEPLTLGSQDTRESHHLESLRNHELSDGEDRACVVDRGLSTSAGCRKYYSCMSVFLLNLLFPWLFISPPAGTPWQVSDCQRSEQGGERKAQIWESSSPSLNFSWELKNQHYDTTRGQVHESREVLIPKSLQK